MESILLPKEIAALKKCSRRDSLSIETVMVAEKFRRAYINGERRSDLPMPEPLIYTIAVLSGAMDGVLTANEELLAQDDEPTSLADEVELSGPIAPLRPKRVQPRKELLAQAVAEAPAEDAPSQESVNGSKSAGARIKGGPLNVRVEGGKWKNARYHSEGTMPGYIRVKFPGQRAVVQVRESDVDYPDLESLEFPATS